MFFWLILLGIPTLHVLWWWRIHLSLRALRRARVWQGLLAGFAGMLLAGFVWVTGTRFAGHSASLPTPLIVLLYVWHLVVLPLAAIKLGIVGGAIRITSLARSLGPRRPHVSSRASDHDADASAAPDRPLAGADSSTGLTRRQVLAATVAVVPPAAALGGTVRAASQMDDFRIRRIDVALPVLPPPLDGLTITNISDVHVGRFTNGATLRRIADAANSLRGEVIVLTGDLIDHRLADLPAGLDMVARLDAPGGVWMCEGNHDLFESRTEFRRRVLASGVPLLLNQAATVRVRGSEFQILGVQWGGLGQRGADVDPNVREVAALRNPEAFAVLLAHHPHAFDAAQDAGIPLTLAGHTHGGQLMLNELLGAGPAMFRYWSGLYRHGDAALVVSNGVGNWFPLRINAPAEIVQVTLRRV